MPLSPLPSILREDFNDHLQQETWPEVYGAERGTLSGEPLKSGTALIFKGVGVPESHAATSATHPAEKKNKMYIYILMCVFV